MRRLGAYSESVGMLLRYGRVQMQSSSIMDKVNVPWKPSCGFHIDEVVNELLVP